MKINQSKFTEDILGKHDILVISNALHVKNITNKKPPHLSAFDQEEITAVHDWVKEGGGLFLIADHAPWGGAAYDLAEKFGVVMSRGTVFFSRKVTKSPEEKVNEEKIKKMKRSLMVMATPFTRESGLVMDHPITRGRNEGESVNHIQTFLGQSLQAPVHMLDRV